jgi:O-glycosyl hydrolase
VTFTRGGAIGRRLSIVASVLLGACLVGFVVLIIVVLAVGGPDPLTVEVAVTDQAKGQALSAQPNLEMSRAHPAAGTPVIRVNTFDHLQHITGFGAAMTDSSASLIEKDLSTQARTTLMDQLFGADGLHLNLLRVPLGASDFTATGTPYSYDDGSADPDLTRFSIAHDRSAILPLLRDASSIHHGLQILATPWSVPGWMKANDALDNRDNAGTVNVADYKAYAAYFVKFIQAYAEAGVNINAITPANEPTNPTAYPGMNIPEATEVRLINRWLEPALKRAGLDPAIFGGDIGWGTPAYLRALVTSVAAKDLNGIASHCYYGDPRVMSQIHDLNPLIHTEMTECSPGISTEPITEVVIGSLRNWASQVDLWNVALNPSGGPVQAPNHGCGGCYGLVTIHPKTGTVTDTSAFNELGQVSEFIDPGAQRVASNNFVHYDYKRPGASYVSSGLDDVAAVNPDGSVALVVYNNSKQTRRFAVEWHGYYVSDTLAAGATISYRWRRS